MRVEQWNVQKMVRVAFIQFALETESGEMHSAVPSTCGGNGGDTITFVLHKQMRDSFSASTRTGTIAPVVIFLESNPSYK